MNTALKYLFFGGLAFVIDFSLLWYLTSIVGVPAWISAFIAFAVSTCFAFLTQQRLTFKGKNSTTIALVRYFILLGVNALFTVLVVYLFDKYLDLYMLGKITATTITTVWNFFLLKNWVFNKAPTKLESKQYSHNYQETHHEP